MRLGLIGILAALAFSSIHVPAVAQAPTDTSVKTRKPPSKITKVAKKVVDSAATAAAAAGVQSLLGSKAGGVANALGAGGVPCSGAGATAGAAIVGAAKGLVKKAADSAHAGSVVPCMPSGAIPGMPGGIPGMPAGMPGMPTGADAAAMAAAALGGAAAGKAGAGTSPLGGIGAVAGMTPIGMAAGAAPGAIKGIKGVLGGKPQDKLVMLRELGKGRLELKGVQFIEGMAVLEPGFEEALVQLAEALGMAEGTYLVHVAAEAGKGAAPDTALARRRTEKVMAAILVNSVPAQRIVGASELPASLAAGRKPPKVGQARVEIIRMPPQ